MCHWWSPDSPLLAQDTPPHGQAVARWTSPSPRVGRGCACLRGGAVHAHGASGQRGRGSHVRPGSAPGTRGLSREAPSPLPVPCSPEPPSWGQTDALVLAEGLPCPRGGAARGRRPLSGIWSELTGRPLLPVEPSGCSRFSVFFGFWVRANPRLPPPPRHSDAPVGLAAECVTAPQDALGAFPRSTGRCLRGHSRPRGGGPAASQRGPRLCPDARPAMLESVGLAPPLLPQGEGGHARGRARGPHRLRPPPPRSSARSPQPGAGGGQGGRAMRPGCGREGL